MEILQPDILIYIKTKRLLSIGIETTVCLMGTSFYTLQLLLKHNSI